MKRQLFKTQYNRSPVKRVSFDRIADEYDKTRELPEDAMNSVLDALCEEMPESSGILDVGSGTARFALPLSRRGFSVVGIDISEEMLGISRCKG
ncbi:MAG: methyltransferase domain-containing protein, partial [Thermoplasmata archaeon]